MFHSVYKCANPCTKRLKDPHCRLPMHVSNRGIYNMSTQSRSVQLWFPNPTFPPTETPTSLSIVCVAVEFTQFTGITFGKAKGHLEVTVSAWVSGWPLGRGGGDHARRGIVCLCACKRPRLNDAHMNKKGCEIGQKTTTYNLNLKYVHCHTWWCWNYPPSAYLYLTWT